MVGAVGERYTLFRLTIVGPCADPKSYYSKKSLLINIAQEEADIIASIKKIGKKAEDIYVKMYKKMFPDSKYTPRII